MGQITFKEGGSIQFKGGTLTFLSYTPMAEPTVTVQWVYESGQYKAKVTMINNDSYAGTLKYTVTLGAAQTSYEKTMAAGETFTNTFYGYTSSPDNGYLFKVEAYMEAPLREVSQTITKETTADFRIYYWNIGTAAMQTTLNGYSYGNGSITPTTGYLELKTNTYSGQSTRSVSTAYPINNNFVKKVIVEFDTINGDNDRDAIYLGRWTNNSTIPSSVTPIDDYHFGSSLTSSTLSLPTVASYQYFIVYIESWSWTGQYPELRIKKFYGESITNGPLVE